MIRGLDGIQIFSGDASKLAKFYEEKVGLKIKEEFEMGDKGETYVQMDVGEGSSIVIADHSKVSGKSKDPNRFTFNLEVKDIEEDVKKLDSAGVKKIKDTYHIEGFGFIATFEDIDGNYFQLVQVRADE